MNVLIFENRLSVRENSPILLAPLSMASCWVTKSPPFFASMFTTAFFLNLPVLAFFSAHMRISAYRSKCFSGKMPIVISCFLLRFFNIHVFLIPRPLSAGSFISESAVPKPVRAEVNIPKYPASCCRDRNVSPPS